MARLILEHQGHSSEHRLTGLTTIGRQSTNDIMVLAEKTSRQHAKIILSGGRFVLEDLGSANGTVVNGARIERHVLANRDEIRIGDAKLTFVDDRSASLEGTTLGNYRIHNRIGQGAMGAVYKATQISMDRIVALKVLRENLVADREFVKGFLNEARTAGKLNHPNVVRVHDFGEAGGVYYFSMEYVNGHTVEEVLNRDGKIPARRALEMIRQVAEALDHAHGLGIIHRDVKPQNIMVDRRGQIKLTDLGLARANRSSSTDKGPIMGTPYYMAPEIARDRRCDQRSDLYSLGASLYHMVTGQVPFDGPDSIAVIAKHVKEPLTSPRKLDPSIPTAVSDLIELLMAKNPALRPSTAGDLIQRIDDILQQKELKQADASDGELKIAPLATPKKKAGPKPRPSARKPAPAVGGAPGEPKKGVRIIKVGGGSPTLYMLMGAMLVAIVGVAVWATLTKKQTLPKDGGGNGNSHTIIDQHAMGNPEAERKLDEARRARGREDYARARELARGVHSRSSSKRLVQQAADIIASLPKVVVAGAGRRAASQEDEAEAASQLATIKEGAASNPEAPVFATRQLLRLIKDFRGTAAAVEAAQLYRKLSGDLVPEVGRILDGAGGIRSGDPRPNPPKAVSAGEALAKARADSAAGEKRGDFFAARRPLSRFIEDHLESLESLEAAELLDRLDLRITEQMRRLYKRAVALSGRSKYAGAEKLLREIIDGDPIGKDRQLATVLLGANETAARRGYEAILRRAKPYLDKQKFSDAARIMRRGAADFEGTAWGGELAAAAESVGMSATLIDSFGKKLEKSQGKGKAPRIKISVGGQRTSVTLVGASSRGLALSRRGVRVVVAWKDLSTEDMLRVFNVFPVVGEDRLGLGAFLFLRGERSAARLELEKAERDAATRNKALTLLGQLDARAKIRRIDFSEFDHIDAFRLDGAWRMDNGQLTYGASHVGTATLRGVEYRGDGFRLSFTVEFLEETGAVEVQLGSGADRCVWFSLGSAGYQAHMQLGNKASDVQGRWKMVPGKIITVSCRIERDTLSVQAAGRNLKPLEARGMGSLVGQVVFRAQGGRLAIDDIITRQSETDGE